MSKSFRCAKCGVLASIEETVPDEALKQELLCDDCLFPNEQREDADEHQPHASDFTESTRTPTVREMALVEVELTLDARKVPEALDDTRTFGEWKNLVHTRLSADVSTLEHDMRAVFVEVATLAVAAIESFDRAAARRKVSR